MKRFVSVLALMLAGAMLAAEARSQECCGAAVAGGAPAAGVELTQTAGALNTGGTLISGQPMQGPILPYSYYASPAVPARVYVPYGATDSFPFRGQAYGNPGDRWSWYSMGGGSQRYLARYYYPILP